MDKSAVDALNKEMYNLTLNHYQTPIQQEILLPQPIPFNQPPYGINTSSNTISQPNSTSASRLLMQKERNNNLLADYQFNHIFSSSHETGPILAKNTIQTTKEFNSAKDIINERMSGISSLARAVAYTGFGGIPK